MFSSTYKKIAKMSETSTRAHNPTYTQINSTQSIPGSEVVGGAGVRAARGVRRARTTARKLIGNNETI